MRKSIILLALILGGVTANAQSVVEGTKVTDNWSVEVNAGAITPLTHSAFFKSMRPAFGVGVSKQLTPIFGLGFQGMGYINTTPSKTSFDASDVSVLGKVNLMNLFAGYKGEPRLFEVEAVAGMGWLHYYVNGDGDQNTWSTRLGLNFNFNLGESKAWTLGIKPAIVYDMQGTYPETKSRFNANNAGFELTAGLTYHFKTSNGTHHFAKVRVYNQAEIDGLNSSINALRSEVNNKDGQISNANQRINGLQEELEACRTKVVPVETAVGLLREFRVKIHELPVVPLDPAHVTRLLDLARYLRVLYDVGHLVGDYLPAEPPVERYRVGIQQRKRAVVLTHAGEALYHKALHNAVTSVLRVCANAGHESNRVLHVVDVHFQRVNGELRHKIVAVKAAEHVRALEHRELRALYLVVLPAGLGKLLLRDLECVSQQCVVLVDIVNRQRSDCIV